MTPSSLLLCAWLLWLLVAAVTDLRIRKVRNWMVLAGLAGGALALTGGAQPFQVPAWHALAGMAIGFAVLLPFYALGWMGAGDVKFAAVAGLWLGLSPALLQVWLGGSLLAGVHAIAVLLWQCQRYRPLGLWLQARVPALADAAPATAPLDLRLVHRQRRRSIPYAGYMAIAAIALLLTGGIA